MDDKETKKEKKRGSGYTCQELLARKKRLDIYLCVKKIRKIAVEMWSRWKSRNTDVNDWTMCSAIPHGTRHLWVGSYYLRILKAFSDVLGVIWLQGGGYKDTVHLSRPITTWQRREVRSWDVIRWVSLVSESLREGGAGIHIFCSLIYLKRLSEI